ncbi:MAG TPA: ABC transporter ATP-binding protein [Gammaproteobacteria bacterium]|nr:ABC transporter ATP-binding protein [Gammaproteobacteria bacterium]
MKNPYFRLVHAVWRYGSSWHRAIVGYYLAFIVGQGFISLTPFAFGRAIDVLQGFRVERLNEVIFWLCASVVFVLLFWVFHGPARVVERHVALKIQQTFRLKMYADLSHLPLKWHQNHHSGNILTRINRSSTALHRFAESQFFYIETIVKFVTSIGFLLWISLPVGFISLFSSLLVMITILLFDRKLIPLYETENEIDNRVGAVLFDYINNMTTILTLRLGELTHANLFQRLMSVWPFFKKEAVLNEIKWFTMMTLLSIIQTVILVGYIVHTLNTTGTIMIGIVVMLFRYQYELHNVFFELSSHYGEIVRMDTDVRGIQPIVDDINRLAYLPQGAAVARQWHTIEISDLTFHHAPGEKRGQIFDNISFKIKRGEKIALIGTSGGGKSTLLNLLCGLYTSSSVSLRIDGISFSSLEPLQAITTLIPQDPELFENTIAFNITLDLPAETDEIHHVVNLAGFSNVLATLPEGLKTDIREKGLNFSVGQKQRLALARGLFAARHSSLILMDEPTSSVDLPTEKEILGKVIDAFPEAALIISLHRLHLLPHFDNVIMLANGNIVAAGSIPDLLNTPGPVYDLWQAYHQQDVN